MSSLSPAVKRLYTLREAKRQDEANPGAFIAELRRLRELIEEKNNRDADRTATADSRERDDLEPLSEREQQVADLIREKSPFPLLGKEICNATGIEQSTLTSQIVPNLKKHGLKNRRGVGYYFP